MIKTVIQLLAILTLISNVFLAYFIFTFVLYKLGSVKKLFSVWRNLLQKKHVLWGFIVALTATSGSLFLSEIAGYSPCKFCWLQRIFMYPLVLILGTALVRKTKDVEKYVLSLSVVGLAIAIYHYHMQLSPNPLAPCSTVGFSVSCSVKFFTYYGYITIPWMSLSAFSLVTLLMLLGRKK